MSHDSSFLKNTLDLIETDPEIKSYIYQQILDFNPFVTPETLVMVIARDPHGHYKKQEAISADSDESMEDELESDIEIDEEDISDEMRALKYRIAIILKEGEHSIEAEAFNDDVFDAIRLAKEALIVRLIEIQEEVENPQDRIAAIQQASDNKPVH